MRIPNWPRASQRMNSPSGCNAKRREQGVCAGGTQPPAQHALDFPRGAEAPRRLYGLDKKTTAEFGTRCLLARRLVEAGVRFVQVYCGDTNGWDGHSDMEGNHSKLCAQSDLPAAGLSPDLQAGGRPAAT